MEETVKNIYFRLYLKGQGIVNYNGNNQLSDYNSNKSENCIYAKKNYYLDENNNKFSKIKISSNCLRHNIFIKDLPFSNTDINNNKNLLLEFLAHPSMILRGYLFANKTKTIKKTTSLNIVDAVQTNNALPSMEFFNKSGDKNSNSIFNKETAGEIEYASCGNINLKEMQFLSMSEYFDRFSLNPDHFKDYKEILKRRFKDYKEILESLNGMGQNYYRIKNTAFKLPELGVLFPNECIVFFTKELFKRLLSININKSGASAKTSKLEYKFIYDPIEDLETPNEGWITITKLDEINNINFIPEIFYEKEDSGKAEKTIKEFEETIQKEKNPSKKKKDE